MDTISASFSESVLEFCRYLRDEGFKIGIAESDDALVIAGSGSFADHRILALQLRTLLCGSEAEWRKFDALFQRFWQQDRGTRRVKATPRRMPAIEEKKTIPLLMIGVQGQAVSDEEGKSTTGANAVERLRKTDFSQVPVHEQERLEALVLRLCRQMNERLTRRLKRSPVQNEVDLRRTIRKNIGHGGDPIQLAYRARKRQKNRLVALLDVSGSMDQYSFFLLLFIHALKTHFEQVDTFLFSTRLTCVNEAITVKALREALEKTSRLAEAWSSGTRIGESFDAFNKTYAKKLLRPDTLVFVLSDGLDTGEPELLRSAMARIKARAKSVIWLNPLKGSAGYEPLAQGMQSALPYIDIFASAHNLDSLLGLEKHLRYV